MRIFVLVGVTLLSTSCTRLGLSQLKPDDVPEFTLQARVVRAAGQAPLGKRFSLDLAGVKGTATGDQWSTPIQFGRPQAAATLKSYPALYLPGWPVVLRLTIPGVVDPTLIEAELQFREAAPPVKLSGELFGPMLGIIVWREAGRPQAATMAQYNRRYWKALEGVAIAEAGQPRRFPLIDRFIGGDDDRRDWQEGIAQLRRAGFNTIMLPPSRPARETLLEAGGKRTAWAVYNPPGYTFDHDSKATPAAIARWAQQQAQPYREAGYAPQDMAVFAMSDEPGWYFPGAFADLRKSAEALARLRRYLQDQHLQPADVGAQRWEDVEPAGRSQAHDLPSRRLFYWTMRFFAHDSARHFAACTKALEAEFYPGMPIFANWNFFSGRFYVPGPVANNPDKRSPDAAMGGHDWLEFGRLRGGSMLWTEDWFGDERAYQWSFYAARLRSAAALGGVAFGGYVVARVGGDRDDGIVQKMLTLVGHGGKAVQCYVFGPEYNFPGNCYSERAAVLRQLAEAHRMIGAAEDVLWPGKPPRSPVAILAPRSAEAWDAKDMALPNQIQDATNNDLNRSTVDYMAEAFDLYLALQHANLPVEFVDEDDLTPAGLQAYRVLYATEPNIPAAGQQGIVDWVRAGGTLVTVCGAGQRDRYDEPCGVLHEAAGIAEQPCERLLVGNARTLADVGQARGKLGPFTAAGTRSVVTAAAADVAATFDDGTPAVVERALGAGRVVHFACMPGISYWKSADQVQDKLPVGFSDALRRWITWPVELAQVLLPVGVNHPLVEAPMLTGSAGTAITLLNWTGKPLPEVEVDVRTDRAVQQVHSVRRGDLPCRSASGHARFAIPLDAADIVTLR